MRGKGGRKSTRKFPLFLAFFLLFYQSFSILSYTFNLNRKKNFDKGVIPPSFQFQFYPVCLIDVFHLNLPVYCLTIIIDIVLRHKLKNIGNECLKHTNYWFDPNSTWLGCCVYEVKLFLSIRLYEFLKDFAKAKAICGFSYKERLWKQFSHKVTNYTCR